jgi:hypothetical protein
LSHRQKIAAARRPSRTPSNGLEMANQKETFQPESGAIAFVFMLFSQAFKDPHFTECEIPFGAALSVARTIRAIPSLSSTNNLRPEVHRDQANQWAEYCESNSDARRHGSGKFLIGRVRNAFQTQFPPSGIELWNASQFWLPSLHSDLIRAGARNPIPTIVTTINGHSATTQKERFQSGFSGVGFLFILFSQAIEEPHFMKRELLFDIPARRFFQNETRTLRALLLSAVRLAIRAIDLVSETATVQPSWFLPANAR